MPVMPCQKDNQNGYKWGENGVCFIGPDAKSRAEEVGRAIKAKGEDMSNSLKNVEIFAAGVHNGDRFTTKDLDDMVLAFNDLDFAPALKQGHNRDVGAPALGFVNSLRRDGEKLVADFVNIPDQVFQTIKRRGFDRVSAEVLFNFKRAGKVFRRVLSAVALLGAEIPAVSSLKPLHKSFTSDDYDAASCYTFEKEKQTMPQADEKLKELQAALDKAQAEAKHFQSENSALVKQLTELSEKVDSFTQNHSTEASEALKAAQDRIALLEDQAVKADAKDYAASVKVPSLRPMISALFEMSETSEKKFSIEEKEVDSRGVLDQLVETINKNAEKLFSETSKGAEFDRQSHEYDDAQAEVDKRVKKFQAENAGATYSDALTAVLNADPDLKQKYAA